MARAGHDGRHLSEPSAAAVWRRFPDPYPGGYYRGMKLTPCAISIPLMLGIVVGAVTHPIAGVVAGLALLVANLVQARREACTTCAWPRQ